MFSTVWQFTAVEFQIKSIVFNFHTTIKEIVDLFQSMSILLQAHSPPDQIGQTLLTHVARCSDFTQFIMHDDS